MSLRCNNRGTVLDIIGIMVALIVVIMGFFFGNILFNAIKAEPLLNEHNETKQIIDEGGWVFEHMADNLIMLVYVGLAISAIISAVLSKAHPIFMYISIIVSMILIVIAVGISNFYTELTSDSNINGIISNYPQTNFIMNHLPTMTLAVIFVVAISLYMTRSKEIKL